MDHKQLFDWMIKVDVEYRDALTRHSLREADPSQWLEFQRRGSFEVQDGVIQHTPESVGAKIWLYDQTAQRAETVDGEEIQEIADFKNVIPPILKEAAINAMLAQIKIPGKKKKV